MKKITIIYSADSEAPYWPTANQAKVNIETADAEMFTTLVNWIQTGDNKERFGRAEVVDIQRFTDPRTGITFEVEGKAQTIYMNEDSHN